MRHQRAAWLAGFCTMALFLAGCSDGLVEVKGTVKVDGMLVEQGAIAFYPADGKSRTAGDVIKNGQYAARVPAGLMKVTISATKQDGTKKLYDTPDSKEIPVYKQTLPAKYADINTTELEYKVLPALNLKDWDLKSE